MLIGLDLPQITAGLGNTSLMLAIGYGLLITLVLIICRILSAYAAVITTMVAKRFITVADTRHPGYKGPFIIGWSGMRGVVSLAAALSIPLQLDKGTEFPQRNLILFITFIVILTTLLLQGLTLPYFIRRARLKEIDYDLDEDKMRNKLKKELNHYMLDYLRKNYKTDIENELLLQQVAQKWEQTDTTDIEIVTQNGRNIYIELLSKQRQWLIERNKKMDIDEEVIRQYLLMLDIEQEKLGLL
jgi:monovalent cation/hydrogen antiporter